MAQRDFVMTVDYPPSINLNEESAGLTPEAVPIFCRIDDFPISLDERSLSVLTVPLLRFGFCKFSVTA
jgi:hypothetical protein